MHPPILSNDGGICCGESMKYFFAGCVFWGIVLLAVYAVRPGAKSAELTVETMGRRGKVLFYAAVLATVLICVLPMSLSPIWNGEILHDFESDIPLGYSV